MKKGFQVIEPTELNGLVRRQENHVFAIAALNWLLAEIKSTIGDRLTAVEIEVIRVAYFGSYPALGIHYKNENDIDVGPLIESTVSRLLRERPAIDLIKSIAESDVAEHGSS
jgi:hypothetical protein